MLGANAFVGNGDYQSIVVTTAACQHAERAVYRGVRFWNLDDPNKVAGDGWAIYELGPISESVNGDWVQAYRVGVAVQGFSGNWAVQVSARCLDLGLN